MTTLLWSLAFLVGIGFFTYQIAGRLKILFQMRKDDGRDYSAKTWGKRIENTLVYAFGQKKFFGSDQPAGIMHAIIFWGFVTLSLQVVTMFVRGWFPEFYLPGFQIEWISGPYGLLKDILEVGVMLSVTIALYRWLVQKPQRLYGILPAEERLSKKSHAEAIVILLFIFTIMLTGLLYDAGRMVILFDGEINIEKDWQPVSYALSGLFVGNPNLADIVSTGAWWVHNLVVLVFLNLLPISKHFHIITSIPNVFFGKVEPKGKLPKKDYSGENALFGRSQIKHFSLKQTLDMYSCTECGRCASVCPAARTGKPLAPRQFLLDLRDTLYAAQPALLKADGFKQEMDVVVGEGKPIMDEVVWSCVACRACEEACPVNIEYVDKIMDLRQHLTQEVSRFPAELSRAFQGMERNSNPWGMAASERAAWADGLEVPLISQKKDVEYLYYVGCGGSFDANNKNATQSFVKILKEAGVSFAILGTEELCNGDSARRLGNEYLFQTMAEALAQTINGYGVKKILTNCPHCFNTLKNEYPDFGGNWKVEHAAAVVMRLVDEGKIKLTEQFLKKVVYHDSCYYGRFNDIYDEPRNLIKAIMGTTLEEMAHCKKGGTCCGAGGGRMWMEEKADQRVNVLRTEEALEKNPEVICTSCPFCRIMIGSGVNEKGLSDKVNVMDVMEVVAKSMHHGGSESKNVTV